jgi:cell wall-associated NlpC family hydrolase
MSGTLLHTPAKRLHARRMAVEAAALALHHAASVHYTQGARRWEGIDKKLRAYRGEYPKHADCSAFVTWCLWQPGLHYDLPDFANGQHWRAGYTGTLVNHGVRVTNDHYLLADVALYGDPFGSSGHTALLAGEVRGTPYVISFGSEAGPFFLPLRYRGDLLEVRRMIR